MAYVKILDELNRWRSQSDMPQSTQDKPISKREQILQAALACFVESGFTATTIEMIRERSGASTGSLYHHFRNKEAIASALFIDAMADHFAALKAALEAIDREREDVAELGVKAIVQTYSQWIELHPDLARYAFLGRGVVADADGKALLAEQNRSNFAYLREVFAPWIQKGLIRQMPVNLYHAILIGPVQDYARHWLAGRVKVPLSAVSHELAEAAWRGVASK